MIFIVALIILSAYSIHTFKPDNIKNEKPVDSLMLDPKYRRKVMIEKFSKAMAEDNTFYGPPPANWSLENFVDKYLIDPSIQYRIPDNWTINNLLENNEHALFRPYVLKDYVKELGLDEDNNNEIKESAGIRKKWSFKDFREKYEPRAICEELEEKISAGQNLSQLQAILAVANRLDPTDEILSLPVPFPNISGRRWRFDSPTIPTPVKKIVASDKEIDNVKVILLMMKQSIYEARERMQVMQTLRDEYRKTALYKMGFIFAKTDYACKIFSSLSYKTFYQCSNIRQRIYDNWALFLHYMDIAYSIERLEDRWFDVDILKDILMSNDIIGRKVVLGDRNITSPQMAVAAFNEMFID